jgi:flagellar basal-body rod protein FlgF
MDKSLYISMTGAIENLRAQTARANNLANASTTGFKADFNQYRSMSVFGEVFPSRAYAMSERPATDLTQGYIQTTNNDLDVAIQGDGWFAVQTPDGQEAYTRSGEFRRDLEGFLVTSDGLPVIGDGGPIQLPEFETIVIG